jgi:hypothetical protein
VAFDVAVEGENEHSPMPSTSEVLGHCQAAAGVNDFVTATPIEITMSMTTVGVVILPGQMFVDHISS